MAQQKQSEERIMLLVFILFGIYVYSYFYFYTDHIVVGENNNKKEHAIATTNPTVSIEDKYGIFTAISSDNQTIDALLMCLSVKYNRGLPKELTIGVVLPLDYSQRGINLTLLQCCFDEIAVMDEDVEPDEEIRMKFEADNIEGYKKTVYMEQTHLMDPGIKEVLSVFKDLGIATNVTEEGEADNNRVDKSELKDKYYGIANDLCL
jgi:hypothetical protein